MFFPRETEIFRAVCMQILIFWGMISCSLFGSYRYLWGLHTLFLALWHGVVSVYLIRGTADNSPECRKPNKRLCYRIFSVFTLRPVSRIVIPVIILSPPYVMEISLPNFFCRNLSIKNKGTLCHCSGAFGRFVTTKDAVCPFVNLVDKVAPGTSSFS